MRVILWPFFERLERELEKRRERAQELVRFTKERSEDQRDSSRLR